jgi:hypothetical protein
VQEEMEEKYLGSLMEKEMEELQNLINHPENLVENVAKIPERSTTFRSCQPTATS